jgi:TolB protein
VSSVDGSGLVQLTHSRDPKSSPCWSPDGQQICFVSQSGKPALYKINATGGTPQRISTMAYGSITEPDWSPDGKKIVFTSMTGSFNLYVVDLKTGETTEALVAGEDPCWAPNSRTVIYTRREGGKRVLSLLDVPTKSKKDVRQISGSCSQPSWAK